MAERTITGRDPTTGESVAVSLAHGRIAAVRRGPARESRWLSAGLVDLQVNGFCGHDVNAASLTVDTVAALTRALHRHGVTTYVPTLVTAPHERTASALDVIARARRADPLSAHAIPYVHLEGPHISDQEGPRGVHDPAFVRPPSTAEFDAWQRAGDGLVGMVTVSPHHAGIKAYIADLTARGVHVAIGHTHADGEQVRAAVAAGARLSTHLGNGAHAVLPRHPNYLWAQLACDDLTAGFIADGHHLPDDTLRAMLRAKGLSRALLVSDAVALAGLAPGRYETPVGGHVDLTPDGRLTAAGTPYLAGAVAGLADGVARAVRAAGIGLHEALALATVRPGRFAGGRGRFAVGAPADLFRFAWAPGDATLAVDAVWVQGTQMYGEAADEAAVPGSATETGGDGFGTGDAGTGNSPASGRPSDAGARGEAPR
ncbi:N-acetylglucosamine-6-phosphate deacetylase [Actinacidiphila acidipaludis]|uniref:Amidohydrolase family protein n=1 Tax=Actinacidiphila acidipaludis TaxID=2873382 RepID=A0ABS7QAV1_9ACTN|nr:amidohydrolase family protein [Streptomyces acidipaludis]MBY8880297.1 amidohydrolase family protein [Streptomyces acidipaludis]